MIKRRQQGAAIVQRAQLVEPYGVEPFEYIALLAVLGRTAISFDESLNFFEACDDAFVSGRTASFVLGLRKIRQFVAQFVKIDITHSGPRP